MAKKEPKYKQIQTDLRNQIIAGKFNYGDKFYTEADIIEHYKVSSITVIRAFKELEKEGYIDRKQGIGTFVSRSRKEKIVRFSDLELAPTSNDTVQVLSIEKGNDPYYMNKLQLHQSEHYYKISRIRYSGKIAYIYHQSYIPHDYILNPQAPLETYQSIYNRFQEDFNIRMLDVPFTETNSICYPSLPDVAQYLQIPIEQPTVSQVLTSYSPDKTRVLEYTETYKHWHYYQFKISSTMSI